MSQYSSVISEDQDDQTWPFCSTSSVITAGVEEGSSDESSWPLPVNATQDHCLGSVVSSQSHSSGYPAEILTRQEPSLQQGIPVYTEPGAILRESFDARDEAFDPESETFQVTTALVGNTEGCDVEVPTSKKTVKVPMIVRISNFIDDWTPLVLVVLYFIISVSVYIVLPEKYVTIAWYIYLGLAFFVSAAVTAEACASNRPARDARRARKRLAETGKFPTPDHLLPSLSLVIVAYLPNEQDIVMQQVRYALREIVYPTEKYMVYLVYNTPRAIEPLETQLQNLQDQYANVRVVRVEKSNSKADNLNYFLENECNTDLIGIYDTDHYAHPHGPRWAAERFCRGDGTDIVQGRCVVYNYADSWVSRAISAEFDMIYAVFHPGRAQSHGFGLFGGANGYWRASLLKQLKMHKHMLTEDIDSTLRAFASGAKMVHELNTVSYEQAPTSVAAFYKQRMRWAQGWFQVAIRHCTLAARGTPGVEMRSRLGLFFLLVFREVFFYILTQFFCLLLGKFILNPPRHLRAVYDSLFGYALSAWILIFNCFSLVAITVLTIRNRSEFTSPLVIIIYGASMPIYFTILSVMGLIAHARELVKYEKWNPTERSAVAPKTSEGPLGINKGLLPT